MKVIRFINTQCIDFGFCINWNYKFGIEISFLFWNIYFESARVRRFPKVRR